MKIAVMNFSGNVGKTTVARHLLMPRLPGAELVCVESINADDDQGQALRGRQFGELQEYLQTVESAVVDIGASNIEDLLGLMRKYRGSHEDFDFIVIPTVSALKQQQDTIATLLQLARIGVPQSRIKLVFNMVEDGVPVQQAFDMLLRFNGDRKTAHADPRCRIDSNEIYERIKGSGASLSELAADSTDFKAQIAAAQSTHEKLALAQKLATRRLAAGVLPDLDACFQALHLNHGERHAQSRQ